MSDPEQQDAFTIERHGDVTLIVPSPVLEQMGPGMVDDAATLLLDPILGQETPLVVVDLARVDFVGSAFLALLIRCWKLATLRGGQMVLSGASERVRDLLHLTSLDVV